MSNNQVAYYEKYLKSTHRLGRAVSVLTLILLLGAPFVIGAVLGPCRICRPPPRASSP